MSSFDTVVFDDTSNAKIQEFKTRCVQLEALVLSLGDSREKLMSVSKLEEFFMWIKQAIEREQVERHMRVTQNTLRGIIPPPSPPVPPPQNLSPEAAILAEGNAKMQDLISSFKELTNNIAANGGISI